ncbi:MAG TPA: ABC transporter ATP-binding protein [Patescibacteria group bacterium]|nr:ABC transporter ATP-binding protein [Patescibacteria group bacterium]
MTLEAIDLVKLYPVRGTDRVVNALNGVSLTVGSGETLGIVGESGCGKSTLAKVLVRLEEPTSGRVVLDGVDLTSLARERLREQRRRIQMVFQDPYSALNPRLTAGRVLDEVLTVHRLAGDASGRRRRVRELLDMVGLPPVFADRFPHEMSGGQRQRVGIARALAVEPGVLLLDEPVSALDVSVRAEIMNLLLRLRGELGLAYLFISHDVAMVRHLSDRVAVMYLGRIVELGSWGEVLDRPRHPYTTALRDAVPVPDPRITQTIEAAVRGEVPDPARPPSGCPFHPRCPLAEAVCGTVEPRLLDLTPGHAVACHVAAREAGLPVPAAT